MEQTKRAVEEKQTFIDIEEKSYLMDRCLKLRNRTVFAFLGVNCMIVLTSILSFKELIGFQGK